MKKDAVITLVVTGVVVVGMTVVMARAQRAASSADFGRTARMGFWRGVKGFADSQSMWWGELGLRAGTMYNRCRL